MVSLFLSHSSISYSSFRLCLHLSGRIFQTEYASEAITHSGAAAGILTKEGIVLVGVQQVTHPLLEPSHEKIFKINDQTACAVAGIFFLSVPISTSSHYT